MVVTPEKMISSLYQISDSGKTESTLRATRKTPPEPVGPGGALWERESVGSADDDGHRAPVLRPARLVRTHRDRAFLAVADRLHARRIDPALRAIITGRDRKRVVSGKSVSVRVAFGGRRIIKKN